jgi:hypothetical protein
VTADHTPGGPSETEVPHGFVIQVTATGDTQEEVEHALDVAGLNKARTIIGELAKAWSGDIFGPDLTPDEWQQVRSAGIPVERIATACYRHALHVVLLHLPEDPPPTILDLEDRFFDGQTLPDALVDFDHVHSTTGICVKAASGNLCPSLDRSQRLSDPTADHTPERLSAEERKRLRALCDDGRQMDEVSYEAEAILAARLADQAARLAGATAAADDWEEVAHSSMARLAAVEALHVRESAPNTDGGSSYFCARCSSLAQEYVNWPCPTIAALHPDQERTSG